MQDSYFILNSTMEVRYRMVFELERLESIIEGCTEKVAFDRGQIAAWLDHYALNRRLRVERIISNGIVQHRLDFMDRLAPLECGGWVIQDETVDWALQSEKLDDGWIRIEVMLTKVFPDHAMFKRADGERIDLGYTDKNYYTFLVDIHPNDVHGFARPCMDF
jgi:hypothetical protein